MDVRLQQFDDSVSSSISTTTSTLARPLTRALETLDAIGTSLASEHDKAAHARQAVLNAVTQLQESASASAAAVAEAADSSRRALQSLSSSVDNVVTSVEDGLAETKRMASEVRDAAQTTSTHVRDSQAAVVSAVVQSGKAIGSVIEKSSDVIVDRVAAAIRAQSKVFVDGTERSLGNAVAELKDVVTSSLSEANRYVLYTSHHIFTLSMPRLLYSSPTFGYTWLLLHISTSVSFT